MKELAALYFLAVLHSGFAGLRESQGKNLRIRKHAYYVRAVLRGVVAGHVAAAVITAAIVVLALTADDHERMLSVLARAGSAALAFYVPYTLVVILTFVAYAVPSVEVRSLVSVVLFGSWTLLLPVVMLAGAVAAVLAEPSLEVALFYGVAVSLVALVEPALAWGGWCRREAAIG